MSIFEYVYKATKSDTYNQYYVILIIIKFAICMNKWYKIILLLVSSTEFVTAMSDDRIHLCIWFLTAELPSNQSCEDDIESSRQKSQSYTNMRKLLACQWMGKWQGHNSFYLVFWRGSLSFGFINLEDLPLGNISNCSVAWSIISHLFIIQYRAPPHWLLASKA